MIIKQSSSSKISNTLVILPKWHIKFDNKNHKEFFQNHMKLKKWQKYVVSHITELKNKKLYYTIFVKLNNLKWFNENIEDIVASVWDEIKSINKNFLIDLNKTDLNNVDKNLFQELLTIKLYHYDKFKSESDSPQQLVFKNKHYSKHKFENFVDSINSVRDLVNTPANELNPQIFQDYIKKEVKSIKNLSIQIIDSNKLKELGLNWIYQVGKWSDVPPRLIILKYQPNKKQGFKFWLVWKWVCFDTGGYNIKPTGFMEDMKIDMWWAWTVFGVWKYLAKIGYQDNFVVAMPLVENMISSKAYKPWDIIKMYNWKTVEVWNTDAEWRLTLADSLAYIQDNFKPKYMIDIATLTWAQLIALWNKIWAIIGNNLQLNKKLQKISWNIKERFWELPLYKPYFKSNKSFAADMNSIPSFGKAGPGTISAWLLLSEFVENKNWVHLDIAWPVGIFSGSDPLWWEWASGFGFRALINFINSVQD